MKSVSLKIIKLVVFAVFAAISTTALIAQSTTQFRNGEKLTYQISFDRFSNVGYAELHVASTGKLSGRDAVELRAKIKTLDFVSAAFFLVDQSRTVYITPDTGLPLYISNIDSGGPVPKETIQNYLTTPTANFDLVSAIYKARGNGGSGTYPVFEDGQQYVVNFLSSGAEKVRTDAGEFDTTVSTVTSEYLTAHGLRDFKINFSTDEERLPVLFRFKMGKNEFRIALAGISKPEPVSSPTSTPNPVKIPLPQITPRPTPSPTPYIDNRPLAPELGFKLGETLEYRVISAGAAAGTITLSAKERKFINGEDSLVLTAEVTELEPGNKLFAQGDQIRTLVDPETLAPRSIEVIFKNAFPGLNGTATFDGRTGVIKAGALPPFEAPVGTHSILSLIYAMRSFNLTPSRDPSSPVNDTRVAVFWESKAYVFTLRPSKSEEVTINGVKMQAQMISISTGNSELDALAPKIWLNMAEGRIPVRFSIGSIQAELIQK
jgi:hypothetical protein